MTLSVAIRHRYPGLSLDVGFDAPEGVTALIGRSGAGKTTVAHVIAGLMRPDSARVTCGGVVLADTGAGTWLSPQARRIGYVFQDARLFPHLSVRQNLLFGARRRGRLRDAEQELPVVCDMLGIAGLLSRRPGALSGGERQRVAIGRALLSGPTMLVLDEPLAALDPARKTEILPHLERLRDEARLPILYVSHAMEEVARLATTVVALDGGRSGGPGGRPPECLLSDPGAGPALDPGTAGGGECVGGGRWCARRKADGLDTGWPVGGGTLWLPRIAAEPGARVRSSVFRGAGCDQFSAGAARRAWFGAETSNRRRDRCRPSRPRPRRASCACGGRRGAAGADHVNLLGRRRLGLAPRQR